MHALLCLGRVLCGSPLGLLLTTRPLSSTHRAHLDTTRTREAFSGSVILLTGEDCFQNAEFEREFDRRRSEIPADLGGSCISTGGADGVQLPMIASPEENWARYLADGGLVVGNKHAPH